MRLKICSISIVVGLAACGGGGGGGGMQQPAPPVISGPAWWGYGRDAQHSAKGAIATQSLRRIVWQTVIDRSPPVSNGAILGHYGSPVITSHNTVVVPVKTTAAGGFQLEARSGSNGSLVWSAPSDYVLPPHEWVPSYAATLTQAERLYAPGAGGKLFYRDNVDSAGGTMQTAVFYGANTYAAASATFDATVIINTPLTTDAAGNVFFGFLVTGANPANLVSGIARLAADGTGTWVGASAAASDAAIVQVAATSAPALSLDGATLYVAVSTPDTNSARGSGYLLALNSTTLATTAKVKLMDPATGTPAWITDNSTSSPTVGPDGDVYFGVLEANFPAHNDRGWLLHFNATLSQAKLPGSFGWDDTASIVPATAVSSYAGASAYLLATKYNDYAGAGTGTGQNKVAILDPNTPQIDSISGIAVMSEVITKLGPTAEASGGVREWCINTAAVDPLTHAVLVNNEDGVLYRWDLATNTFSEQVRLTAGIGEAYTPTLIGPDGTVYAINNAILFAVGQ